MVRAKAVSHIHSEWSYDGKWSLSAIADFFGKLGYDLVLTAEHDRTFDNERWEAYKQACDKASTKKTLIVPGIEYADADDTVHILAWGVSEFLGRNHNINHLLQKANQRNGICVLAHPGRRNAWKQIDESWMPLLKGIEIWNRKFDGIAPSEEAVGLLKRSPGIISYASLDFHEPNQLFPLSMMIQIDGVTSIENAFGALRRCQCRPLAFGLPAAYFTDGFLLTLAKIIDRVRRGIFRIIKG